MSKATQKRTPRMRAKAAAESHLTGPDAAAGPLVVSSVNARYFAVGVREAADDERRILRNGEY